VRLLPLGLIDVHGKQTKLLKGERILEELGVTKLVIIDNNPSELVMNLDLFSYHELNTDSHNGLLHVFSHLDTFHQVGTGILGSRASYAIQKLSLRHVLRFYKCNSLNLASVT